MRERPNAAVAVPENSFVRVFNDGKMISAIISELWMLKKKFGMHFPVTYTGHSVDDIPVVSRKEPAVGTGYLNRPITCS